MDNTRRAGVYFAWCMVVVALASCSPTSSPPPEAAPTASPPPPQLPPTAGLATETVNQACDDPFAGGQPAFRVEFWPDTNFCIHSVPLSEFQTGGPPPDGIRPIDNPRFETVQQADAWLGDKWPVMVVRSGDGGRAYPLAMLILHEIVNDSIDDQPIAVTYCPLCNAAIVFNRQLPTGDILDFGTTGNLRNNDLVMYDRQTKSWWQQVTGEAVVGTYTGARLEFLPSQIIGWQEFAQRYPEGEVLSRDSIGGGYLNRYGFNPYGNYDSRQTSPLHGFEDDRLATMDRVAGVQSGSSSIVFPFSELAKIGVANASLGDLELVAFWRPDTLSMLDSGRLEDARAVGSSAVFNRVLDGQAMEFESSDVTGEFLDVQTGTRWNMFGQAIEGSLAGAQLEPVVAGEHFWFAWAAFFGDSQIWRAPIEVE